MAGELAGAVNFFSDDGRETYEQHSGAGCPDGALDLPDGGRDCFEDVLRRQA
jgi:hypothetical protein